MSLTTSWAYWGILRAEQGSRNRCMFIGGAGNLKTPFRSLRALEAHTICCISGWLGSAVGGICTIVRRCTYSLLGVECHLKGSVVRPVPQLGSRKRDLGEVRLDRCSWNWVFVGWIIAANVVSCYLTERMHCWTLFLFPDTSERARDELKMLLPIHGIYSRPGSSLQTTNPHFSH